MREPKPAPVVPSRVYANQHIRSMKGQTQSKLVRASDGGMYVCKFCNNPEGSRVLVNEVLGSRIAAHLGLPTPPMAYVEVDPWLVQNTPELTMQIEGSTVASATGLQFGSRYIVGHNGRSCLDWFPENSGLVTNRNAFVGALVFDVWTGNTDCGQAIYQLLEGGSYKAFFVDYSQCFDGSNWRCRDKPLTISTLARLRTLCRRWDAFERWLNKIDAITEVQIWEWTQDIPTEWYANDIDSLRSLISELCCRRQELPRLISDLKESVHEILAPWEIQAIARVQELVDPDLWCKQAQTEAPVVVYV